mmetsp:Transcript_63208/g.73981  ORF Transcript_63208/g.73981 Transcript_63208/m.73981 type:complete len:86 (+) Transcript_63208:840-1097(+)
METTAPAVKASSAPMGVRTYTGNAPKATSAQSRVNLPLAPKAAAAAIPIPSTARPTVIPTQSVSLASAARAERDSSVPPLATRMC